MVVDGVVRMAANRGGSETVKMVVCGSSKLIMFFFFSFFFFLLSFNRGFDMRLQCSCVLGLICYCGLICGLNVFYFHGVFGRRYVKVFLEMLYSGY